MIDHFKKLEPSTTPMTQLHYHLSDESEQDASTIATHINIILCFLPLNGFISSFLTTMWYHMDGCENQYNCESDIYLLLFLTLEFCNILTDRLVQLNM